MSGNEPFTQTLTHLPTSAIAEVCPKELLFHIHKNYSRPKEKEYCKGGSGGHVPERSEGTGGAQHHHERRAYGVVQNHHALRACEARSLTSRSEVSSSKGYDKTT